MKKILLILTIALLTGCLNITKGKTIRASVFFTIDNSKEYTPQELSEKIRIGNLLKPELVGEKLILNIPDAQLNENNIPRDYYEYIVELTEIFNTYLPMSDDFIKSFFPDLFAAYNPSSVVLGYFMQKKDGKVIMKIDKNKALKLGVPDSIYTNFISDIDINNELFETIGESYPGIPNFNVNIIIPFHIFDNDDSTRAELTQKIDLLNFKY